MQRKEQGVSGQGLDNRTVKETRSTLHELNPPILIAWMGFLRLQRRKHINLFEMAINHHSATNNKQDLIFYSALSLSMVLIAGDVSSKSTNRDKSQITSPFKIDNEVCNTIFTNLKNILKEKFYEILDNFYESIENNQSPKTRRPILVAPHDSSSMNFRDIELASCYGYDIAKEILKTLRLLPNSEASLEKLLSSQEPSIKPQLFKSNEVLPVSSSFVISSSLEAQIQPELWEIDSDGFPFYRKKARKNPNNFIEHYISNPGDITLLPWDEAQQIIDKFGFETAKLHIIFAAYCLDSDEPWKERFYLKASNLVKDLGWDKRTDLSKGKLFNKVGSLAFILGCLMVKATWIEGENKKGQVQASCPIGRMWDVVVEPQGQLDLHGKITDPIEVIISVRPGGWTESFLNKAKAKAKTALYQFGWLSREVLKIDPYHDELALRLALHLTLENTYHKSGRYRVKTLLENILPTTEINKARSDRRRGYDLKKRWDSALKLLISLDWSITYDSETYPQWLQPGDKEQKPKGYLDKLLEAKITILQPEPIPAFLASKAKPITEKLTSPKQNPLRGLQLREARKARGWSQKKLSTYSGISQSLISQIERGSRDIPKRMENKLRKLLSIPDPFSTRDTQSSL
jgi:DNA-binding transcriptional regulator YiaG